MTPSHATKGGRRYRYYCSANARIDASDKTATWRLPAAAVENAVLEEIHTFLRDPHALCKKLGLSNDDPSPVIARAAEMSKRLSQTNPADQRVALFGLVRRVDLSENRIAVKLNTNRIRVMLIPDIEAGMTSAGTGVTLDIPIMFRRRGVETKFVLADRSRRPPQPDPTLIALIARGHQWLATLREGEVGSLTDLAKENGVDRADAGRALSLAFLAPDIVEAIADGRQPAELTAAKLRRCRNLPVLWSEQRAALGFDR